MLHIGTAETDITPPEGSLMSCFPRGRDRAPRRAAGIRDRLKARALALRDGAEAAVICACDLAFITAVDVSRVREMVCRKVAGLEASRVVITCAHTHSSPETTYLFGNTPDTPEIMTINRNIADAAVRAFSRLEPVSRLLSGRVTVPVNHNRRVIDESGAARMALEYEEGVTAGPCDPELAVLRLDCGDSTRAILFNFAAHALTLGPGNDLYSADYPGLAREIIDGQFEECMSLFCNGAAGNIHPRCCMRTDDEALVQIGEALGRSAVEAATVAAPVDYKGMKFASETLEFPNRLDPALTVETEVSCLRLGDVVLAFVPGEPYNEFQLEFKRRVRPLSGIFVGYANGWVGYMPTREAYGAGGYGVELYSGDPPRFGRTVLPPGAGESVLERLLGMTRNESF